MSHYASAAEQSKLEPMRRSHAAAKPSANLHLIQRQTSGLHSPAGIPLPPQGTSPVQRAAFASNQSNLLQRTAQQTPQFNKTGIPTPLKSGMEQVSGVNMDAVKVHYNSSEPAKIGANAYAEGNQVHLGPSQERHLPHELGHVVQQSKGAVKPQFQTIGKNVNADPKLESEATSLGNQALAASHSTGFAAASLPYSAKVATGGVAQRTPGESSSSSANQNSVDPESLAQAQQPTQPQDNRLEKLVEGLANWCASGVAWANANPTLSTCLSTLLLAAPTISKLASDPTNVYLWMQLSATLLLGIAGLVNSPRLLKQLLVIFSGVLTVFSAMGGISFSVLAVTLKKLIKVGKTLAKTSEKKQL